MLTRHAIQVLRKAGHTQAEVATLTGVSEREVRRVEREPAVENLDLPAERERRSRSVKKSSICWPRSRIC